MDVATEISTTAAEERRFHPEIRLGQALFNALYDLKPDLANEIRGNSDIDPFYKDGNIPAFYEWLATKNL